MKRNTRLGVGGVPSSGTGTCDFGGGGDVAGTTWFIGVWIVDDKSEVKFRRESSGRVVGLTMGGGKNSAGSGNFEVVAYQEGVAMWAANGLQIAYDSVHPYASITRANLSVKALNEGDEIRLDITEVFGGAATVYPDAAVVTFVGVAY